MLGYEHGCLLSFYFILDLTINRRIISLCDISTYTGIDNLFTLISYQ